MTKPQRRERVEAPRLGPVVVADEVKAALAAGRGVVALESTLLTHGLPRLAAIEFGAAIEADVRAAGAVPATIGVLDGTIRVGFDSAELEALIGAPGVAKAGIRDLPFVCARGGSAGTTVASTALVARMAGIAVFATGGLGGVHRDFSTSHDESGDLGALAQLPITVVCAGVKSILDVGATLERMETLNVGVVGFGTDRFPGFYIADSGFAAPARVDTVGELAEAVRIRDALGLPGAIVVAVTAPDPMDPERHDELLAAALTAAQEGGVVGPALTPFVLAEFARRSGGDSVAINCALVRRNATLGGELAVALASSTER